MAAIQLVIFYIYTITGLVLLVICSVIQSRKGLWLYRWVCAAGHMTCMEPHPLQTQHPGIYYQQAAQHALQRKRLANQICKASCTNAPRVPHTLSSTHLQEAGRSVGSSPAQPADTRYLGQRQWRKGILGKYDNQNYK